MTEYTPPALLFNAHLETIYPSVFRKVALDAFVRERIPTPDNDFLDIDWLKQGAKRLVIISHGLEGDSHRPYMKGMARAFYNKGFDVLAWNYRGCSGEMNRQLRFYHSGASDDLDVVIRHAVTQYADINLIGFSLGGNLTLKYLGESRVRPEELKKAVVFSVPMDLYRSCLQISKPTNFIYSRRFLRSLKKKILSKAALMSGIDVKGIEHISNLKDFDDRYTAPLHGFANAMQYYEECSAIRFVKDITLPTLIVSAANDPFLSPECFPKTMLNNHPHVRLEVTDKGGHVGFSLFNDNGLYWSEIRALQFIALE